MAFSIHRWIILIHLCMPLGGAELKTIVEISSPPTYQDLLENGSLSSHKKIILPLNRGWNYFTREELEPLYQVVFPHFQLEGQGITIYFKDPEKPIENLPKRYSIEQPIVDERVFTRPWRLRIPHGIQGNGPLKKNLDVQLIRLGKNSRIILEGKLSRDIDFRNPSGELWVKLKLTDKILRLPLTSFSLEYVD